MVCTKAPLLLLVLAIFAAYINCLAENRPAVAQPVAASKVPSATNQPPTNSLSVLRVKSLAGGTEDLGTQAILTAGEYKIRFHAPTGWVLRQQGGEPAYALAHKASAGKISLRLNAETSGTITNYTHEARRSQVLSQYKDARLVAEYQTAALGTNNALVWDLALPLQGNPWVARLVFIPCPAGEIQVVLFAPKEQSEGPANVMMSIIASMEFRKSNEAFQVVPANQGL